MKTKIFFFLNLLSFTLFAQVSLTGEKIELNKYTLTYSNNVNYNIINKDNHKTILFPGFMDESKSGYFILPESDIIIAIPANTHPEFKVNITRQEKLNAVPQVNPETKTVNDSTVIYKDARLKNDIEEYQSKLKGYLWIGNNYCIQISVKLFEYKNMYVLQNKDFSIELTFKENIPQKKNNRLSSAASLLKSKYDFTVNDKYPKYALNNADDWIDYTKTYLKIGTAADAIYRIDKNDLVNNNISVSAIDPQTFKLFCKGNEIPIYIRGEGDASFDDSDFIEFVGRKNFGDIDYREVSDYGEPYKEFSNRYSDTTIYWLTWGGGAGLRADTIIADAGTVNDTIDYYDDLIHTEQNMWYDFSLAGGTVRRELPEILENETWSWWGQNVGTKSFPFTATDLYPGKPAKAFVKIQSWSTNLLTNSHILSLKLNTDPTVYDSGYIDKYDVKVLKAEFSSNLLTEGNNSLKVVSYETSSNPNRCFGDWWEIEYPRLLKLENDSINFSYRNLVSPVLTYIKISGVNLSDFSLYKLLDKYNFTKITNFSLNGNILTFKDSIHQGDNYLLSSTAKISKPIFYYKKQFTNLRSPDTQADYILITHPVFLNTAADYNSFIENHYHLKTKLINVFDIYDEFNFGFFAPEPIKDFLIMTHQSWQAPFPKFVFIVGRSTYDFHGYKTKYFNAPVEPNLVPSYGMPVSDYYYVIWDSIGAAIPQMDIGRLPARNLEEFQHYFSKHQNYVDRPYGKWNKRYLFLSGGNFNDPSQIAQLKNVSDFVKNNYTEPSPIGGQTNHFYKTTNPVSNFGPFTSEEVQTAFDSSGIFISYLGHSGTQTWDNGITDQSQLDNSINRYPMITDFGCSTAKFAEPDVTSFSELFVNGLNGQSIIYVGNSSLGFTSTSLTFPQVFFKKILVDSVYNIGDAHRLGKIEFLNTYGSSGSFRLFSFTNSLVGDPIITLPIPPKPNLFIESSDISFNPLIPSDANDSVKIDISYLNLGMANSDSFNILITDTYKGELSFQFRTSRILPLYIDSLEISLPVKDKPGEHTLNITLDEENKIDELEKSDNTIELNLNILSSSIRTTNVYEIENKIRNQIVFLNPVADPASDNFEIQLSETEDFQNPVQSSIQLDTLYTKFSPPSNYSNERFWMRAKLPSSQNYGLVQSFFISDDNGYILNDSISFNKAEFKNISYKENSVSLDSTQIVFSVLSAGFNDGNTAIISKNSQNLIPENTLRGHHVCIFRDTTYEFLHYKLFDLLGGGTAAANDYKNFIDTLSNKYLIMIAVSDEGEVGLTNELKDLIKEFGSIYIDSLVFRGSWAFIGKRGAVPGSMPEKFSKPFNGRVKVDSTIVLSFTQGELVTGEIGPSSLWNKLNVDQDLQGNSSLTVFPVGIKNDNQLDTLDFIDVINGTADLGNIDAEKYPFIKFVYNFTAGTDGISPVLKSLSVDYNGPAELGTNYQVVSINKDSLSQGEFAELSFYVYNIGDAASDSIDVAINVIHAGNQNDLVYSSILPPINPFDRKKVTYSYNTVSTNGSKQFLVSIDRDNKIPELFTDNNFFTIPFYVKSDSTRPSLVVTFDGREIINGEYVSTHPDIRMELSDPSLIPIEDTSAVHLTLNGNPIYYAGNEDILSFSISEDNPKFTLEYKPVLEDGDYSLVVDGRDASGNVVDSNGVATDFIVSSETKIIDLYNYPNPFAEDTYFTFKLTQIPDKLKFRIYTIAGRLIKEIDLTSGQLKNDFNRIYWDGRDEDGDRIANGVYIYKVIMTSGEDKEVLTQKLAVVR